MNDQARQLIEVLHRGGTFDYWWTAEGRQSFWWEVGKPTPLPNGRRNVYFGVHPTALIPETNRRGEPAESRAVRSRIEHIAAVNCLFAEFDARDFDESKEKALAHIDALVPAPSIIVDSGGGYHCYWLLDQTWRLETTEDRNAAARLQSAWVKLMGGDEGAKDLARVLRVPGTHNYKYDPPRNVEIVRMDGARYTLETLATYAAPFVERTTVDLRGNGPDPDRYAAAALAGETARVLTAPDGSKHHQLYKSAAAIGELVGAGLLDESAVRDLLYEAIAPRAADPRSAEQTIKDGIAKGKMNPRELPRRAAVSGDIVPSANAPLAKPVTQRPALTPPIDFHDLLARPRQPIKWYAPSFFREGLGVLAGEANVGKTPLVVQLGIAIASGGLWLNKVECEQAKVLFIGTEYTRDELAHVIESSAAGVSPPPGTFAFKCLDDGDEIQPERPEDALMLLEHYIRDEGYQAIIIDVMTGFLPDEPFKQNVYRGDYKELKPYHVLALKYHALILGTWHSVKRETNPRYMYNGSSGLWAVPASRVTLFTDAEQRVRIFSMPRFCPKVEWAIAQEVTLAGRRWVASDAAPEPAMGEQEQIIYRWLKDNADKANPRTPQTIAEMTGLPPASVRTMLRRMFDKNLIQQPKIGTGYYVDVIPVTPVTDVTPVTSVTEHFDTDSNKVTQKSNNDEGRQDASNNKSNKSNTVTRATTIADDTIARLRTRGTPRVLTGKALQDALSDSSDTTFTELSKGDDDAIEG